MAVRVYDPTGRLNRRAPAPRRPSTPQQPQVGGASGDLASRVMSSSYKPPKQDDDDKGLAESFFGTTVGRGLGVVLNNSVVKNLIQPLDLLGVPQRAIASSWKETADLFTGNGASFQDLYDQINPAFAFHGENAEDSIGMGDIWQEYSPIAGQNRYLDAAVGFAGDVATDPLTYAFGLGVVDKGLDGLRAGTRLGAALKGGEEATKALRKADDVARGAAKGVNPSAGRGSRASLTGRRTLEDRVVEADQLIRRADTDTLNKLYGGGADVTTEALNELRYRVGRSLGDSSDDLSEGARELVETALNINPPAVRMRPPLSRSQGVALPGTGRLAQGAARRVGNRRMKFAGGDIGEEIGNMRTPIDLEGASRKLRLGERMTPEEFGEAATTYRLGQGARPSSGKFLNLFQRPVRALRKELKGEAKSRGNAQYLDDTEMLRPDGSTTKLGEAFRQVRRIAGDEFGVTLADLDQNLNYVPHVVVPKFRRMNPDVVDDLVGRYGQGEQSLQRESGRMMRRLKAGEEIPIAGGKPLVIPDTPTVTNINKAAIAHPQIGFKILEDEPIKLLDDYIQAVSEDVGRRVARADEVAISSQAGARAPRYVAYDANMPESQWREVAREQAAAWRRTGAAPVEDADVNRILRLIEDGQLETLFREMTDEWVQIGDNRLLLENAAIDDMLRNTVKQINQNPHLIARALRTMNRYFKTFAVLSPGFHIRNGLSAIFMNSADGVEMTTTVRGIELWRKFSKAAKNGEDWDAGRRFINERLNSSDSAKVAEGKALEAVFGSGAGGRFTEAGIAEGFGKVGSKIMENRITRKSQDAGAFVEGSVRTGMALDTLEKGGSVQEAVSRITRVHFDYNQVSRFDDTMKQFIPFWSFVSRNTPMQIMQQWSRPRAYQMYEHFRENFQDEEQLAAMGGEEALPDYIRDGRGFSTSLIPGMNWLEPDLPHTRVAEDVERLANIGDNPLGATSNFSPVFTAPAEYAAKQDFFTGQQFGPEDYEHVSNPLDWLAVIPATLLNKTKMVDGELFVKTEVLNAVEALDPNFARASRLTGAGGQESARIPEGWARWFGAPVRNITQRQLDSAETGRYYDELDERRVQQELERLARGG